MKTFLMCFLVLCGSAVVLYDELSIVLRAVALIILLVLVWLDGAVRESQRCLKELEKCQTLSKP